MFELVGLMKSSKGFVYIFKIKGRVVSILVYLKQLVFIFYWQLVKTAIVTVYAQECAINI